MSHDEIVKRRIVKSIASCKHIPMDREKRAKKIAGYMDTEFEREKNPEQTAQTIKDLQEEIHRLRKEKEQNSKGIIGRIRKHLITKR